MLTLLALLLAADPPKFDTPGPKKPAERVRESILRDTVSQGAAAVDRERARLDQLARDTDPPRRPAPTESRLVKVCAGLAAAIARGDGLAIQRVSYQELRITGDNLTDGKRAFAAARFCGLSDAEATAAGAALGYRRPEAPPAAAWHLGEPLLVPTLPPRTLPFSTRGDFDRLFALDNDALATALAPALHDATGLTRRCERAKEELKATYWKGGGHPIYRRSFAQPPRSEDGETQVRDVLFCKPPSGPPVVCVTITYGYRGGVLREARITRDAKTETIEIDLPAPPPPPPPWHDPSTASEVLAGLARVPTAHLARPWAPPPTSLEPLPAVPTSGAARRQALDAVAAGIGGVPARKGERLEVTPDGGAVRVQWLSGSRVLAARHVQPGAGGVTEVRDELRCVAWPQAVCHHVTFRYQDGGLIEVTGRGGPEWTYWARRGGLDGGVPVPRPDFFPEAPQSLVLDASPENVEQLLAPVRRFAGFAFAPPLSAPFGAEKVQLRLAELPADASWVVPATSEIPGATVSYEGKVKLDAVKLEVDAKPHRLFERWVELGPGTPHLRVREVRDHYACAVERAGKMQRLPCFFVRWTYGGDEAAATLLRGELQVKDGWFALAELVDG